MTDKISALMDGELERQDAAGVLQQLNSEGEARDAWRRYHLIGDVMRDTRLLSPGFAARVSAHLATEPTVLAPAALPKRPSVTRWHALSAAASLAAVAMVGWIALAPAPDAGPQIAKDGKQAPTTETAQASPAQVAPPDAANDYLLAHQGYSPRNTLQGVAPYVRMVSSESAPRKP